MFHFGSRDQSPKLTKEERRLIDEAVAAGKVRVIPRGVSAYAPVAVYNPAQSRVEYTTHSSPILSRRRKLRDERIQQYARLHLEGMDVVRCANALGISIHTAEKYRTMAVKAGLIKL